MRSMMRHGFTIVRVALVLGVVTASTGAVAQDACPAAPPVVRDITLPRFYGDKDGSVIDPERDAAHKAAVAPLTAFVRAVTQDADKALRRSKPEAQKALALCTLTWIATWAKGDAWLGTMATRQAEYQRKWDLAGVALAYLKLKPFATAEQRQVIEPWLKRFADVARTFFDDRERQRNNHWYWLGLGAAAVGMAAESPQHWEMAREIMRDAARDIGTDGTLKAEMTRKSRALLYHAFALTPLVVMAELAASRGEDWYGFEAGAVHRLAKLTIDGLNAPETFDACVGVAQERPVNGRAGWVQLYRARFPERVETAPDIPEGHRWIGGSAAVLRDVLGRR
ncbi:MAG: alginate lyase family protein [Hyphomicrobium sp.]